MTEEKTMHALRIVLLLWFAFSVANAVIGNFVLVLWLYSHEVRVRFSRTNSAGYVLNRYRDLCERQGKSARPIEIYYILSVVSVILSSPFGILLTQGSNHH